MNGSWILCRKNWVIYIGCIRISRRTLCRFLLVWIFFLGFSKSYSKDAKSWHKDLENYSFNKIVLDFWMPDLLVWAVFSLTLVPSCVRDWTQYFTYVPGPVWANSIYFIHYFHTNCWCSECTLGSALKDHPWQFSGTVCDAGDWTQAHQGK